MDFQLFFFSVFEKLTEYIIEYYVLSCLCPFVVIVYNLIIGTTNHFKKTLGRILGIQ